MTDYDMFKNRMVKQWTEMQESPLENCWAEPREDSDGQIDFYNWDAIIFGPAGNININVMSIKTFLARLN
jgi:ubiquitin-protein ligase